MMKENNLKSFLKKWLTNKNKFEKLITVETTDNLKKKNELRRKNK